MRLLQTTTLRMEEFFAGSKGPGYFAKQHVNDQRLQNQGIPKYATLSHTCEFANAHRSPSPAKGPARTRSPQ
jgi:hypothetical protein